MRNNRKAQSAMEYLMTYGWAILIIAVVLGALFSLGLFGSNTGTNACVSQPGYLCSSMVLGSNGNLSFTFGQSSGSTIYNVGVGCAAVVNSAGLPNVFGTNTGINLLSATGAATTTPAFGTNTGLLNMPSGETLAITGVKCYGTDTKPVTSPTIGTSYSGALWINYTQASGTPGGSNAWLTAKFATISAKVA